MIDFAFITLAVIELVFFGAALVMFVAEKL
jgi:hypothetical protein